MRAAFAARDSAVPSPFTAARAVPLGTPSGGALAASETADTLGSHLSVPRCDAVAACPRSSGSRTRPVAPGHARAVGAERLWRASRPACSSRSPTPPSGGRLDAAPSQAAARWRSSAGTARQGVRLGGRADGPRAHRLGQLHRRGVRRQHRAVGAAVRPARDVRCRRLLGSTTARGFLRITQGHDTARRASARPRLRAERSIEGGTRHWLGGPVARASPRVRPGTTFGWTSSCPLTRTVSPTTTVVRPVGVEARPAAPLVGRPPGGDSASPA